jgi:hypothetical protein
VVDNSENNSPADSPSYWRRCSSCKKPIALGTKYYTCSVSTCNGLRTGYVFCSVSCFERHLPGARHKQAGAIEQLSPKVAGGPIYTPSSIAGPTGIPKSAATSSPREVLIIASRLKDYIAARADFNTSGGVMDVLSDYVRLLCDRAIDQARAEGRKTVLDRDFDFLKK